MLCPTDGATLTMSERAGIEIDYCPECRGVWLDRGELDKIIDRGAAQSAAPAQQPVPQHVPVQARDQRYDQGYQQEYNQGHHQGYGGRPRKRRENWLSEIFD